MPVAASYKRLPDERVDFIASLPFIAVHFIVLAVFWLGVHKADIILCLCTFWIRMFSITGGYHRYFSHRGYKTSRWFQFVLAFLGTTCTQKGVLWWAAHHRDHHRYSDMPQDIHSPKRGFWWSHMIWILCPKFNRTKLENVPDLAKYPELRWLNKHHLIPPIALAMLTFLIGGWSGLLWGYFISTMLLWHSSFTVNSLAHVFGSRRYNTSDTSRNNWLLALLTMGEGWHNNHHHYMATANNGFYWWEVDATYYVLKAMSWLGLVWDLRTPSAKVLLRNRISNALGRIKGKAAEKLHDAGDALTGAVHEAGERIHTAVTDARAVAREAKDSVSQVVEETATKVQAAVEKSIRTTSTNEL
ncbi:MAG: fatty acid desaturase [Acidobacteria bacterium]|nr:fatty acid desaturase [Acidobacteriota bacterium]